jgi:hypothetical protein
LSEKEAHFKLIGYNNHHIDPLIRAEKHFALYEEYDGGLSEEVRVSSKAGFLNGEDVR